ncbi:ankyrin repeat-containing domain protein, partial [Tuber borchii]
PSFLTVPDHDGNTPLHEAAISGHSSMLKALIKELARHNTDSTIINEKNHFGNTPLHLAFQFDHPEIVDLLLQGGANATIKNN